MTMYCVVNQGKPVAGPFDDFNDAELARAEAIEEDESPDADGLYAVHECAPVALSLGAHAADNLIGELIEELEAELRARPPAGAVIPSSDAVEMGSTSRPDKALVEELERWARAHLKCNAYIIGRRVAGME